MGSIKSTAIKKLAEDTLEEDASAFSADFEKNKALLRKMRPATPKKIRNIAAGYITRVIHMKARRPQKVPGAETEQD